jgi:ABC-type uncharacterized transport system permease subunit
VIVANPVSVRATLGVNSIFGGSLKLIDFPEKIYDLFYRKLRIFAVIYPFALNLLHNKVE